MKFEIEKSLEILERTPNNLRSMLHGLSNGWTDINEGENTWNAYDVIGHLIHGENTDWVPRTQIILHCKDKEYKHFNRFAQFENSKGKNLTQLLNEFELLRNQNLKTLKSFSLKNNDLSMEGIHPELGTVNISHLLSTWVVHDLGHIAQISRVMAKQYKTNTGPWVKYLSILN